MKNFPRPLLLAGAMASLPLLSACSDASDVGEAGDDAVTQQEASRTVAASLIDLPEMTSLNGAISGSQLAPIFDGPASYTLLAPNDEAFEALGEEGKALLTPEQRPVLVGLIREHILPGHLTPENIGEALDQQEGEVTMTTLGGGEVTFSRDGETITVTNGGGSTARLTDGATAATNGVIIPLDAVLAPNEATEG